MDIGVTIMGIVIAFICALPIILSVANNRKKRKKIEQGLFEFANRSNCKISKHEFSNNVTIGIDESAQVLFFTKKTKDDEVFQQINLFETQRCRVVDSTRNVKSKSSNFNVLEKIELAFEFHDKSKKEALLEFYSHIKDGSMFMGEVQFVEKWCKIVNDKISANSDKT